MHRLKDYTAACGYTVAKEVTEIASGLNDMRPKYLKLLADTRIRTMLVEHKDRGTRFEWNYFVTLLHAQGRHREAIFSTDTHDDLVNDFVSMITSIAARIYDRRKSKRRAKKIKQCVEQVMKQKENGLERQAIRTLSDGNSVH
jgi:putative resolvase